MTDTTFLSAKVFERLGGGSEAALIGFLTGVLDLKLTPLRGVDLFFGVGFELEAVLAGGLVLTEKLSSFPINFSMTRSRL